MAATAAVCSFVMGLRGRRRKSGMRPSLRFITPEFWRSRRHFYIWLTCLANKQKHIHFNTHVLPMVLEVGRALASAESPRAKTLGYFLCCKVALSTSTKPCFDHIHVMRVRSIKRGELCYLDPLLYNSTNATKSHNASILPQKKTNH